MERLAAAAAELAALLADGAGRVGVPGLDAEDRLLPLSLPPELCVVDVLESESLASLAELISTSGAGFFFVVFFWPLPLLARSFLGFFCRSALGGRDLGF